MTGHLVIEVFGMTVFAIVGNQDARAGELEVGTAMREASLIFLGITHIPLERNGWRVWLAGIDDLPARWQGSILSRVHTR